MTGSCRYAGQEHPLRRLRLVVRIFCLLPLLTGTLDFVKGVPTLRRGGAVIPDNVAKDPALNSQIGFWGAIWLGYGLTLWRASADPRADAGLLRLQLGILFLSGIGRASAAIRFGPPSRPLREAMVLELVGPPVLLLWHRVLLGRAG